PICLCGNLTTSRREPGPFWLATDRVFCFLNKKSDKKRAAKTQRREGCMEHSRRDAQPAFSRFGMPDAGFQPVVRCRQQKRPCQTQRMRNNPARKGVQSIESASFWLARRFCCGGRHAHTCFTPYFPPADPVGSPGGIAGHTHAP